MKRHAHAFFLALAVFSLGFFSLVVSAFVGPSATPPSGSAALYLDSNSNLGIGTTNPTPTNLTVGRFFAVGTSTNPGFFLSDTNGRRYVMYVNSGGNLAFYDDVDGAERFYIATSGDVYAVGNVYANAFVGSLSGAINAGNVSSGVFGSLQGNGAFAFPASLGVATSSQTGLPASLSVYGNTYVSGNVGIGTSTPIHTLTVYGSDADVNIGNAFVYTPSANMDFAVGSNSQSSRFIFGQSTSNYGGMKWYYNATPANAYLGIGATSGFSDITILQTGLVGIGTSTPTYKLTVAGEVYSTGSSTASAFCLSGTCQTSWSGLGQWQNGTDGIYYQSKVSVGTSTLAYPLLVGSSTDSLFALRRGGATYPTIFKQGTDGVLVINNANTDTISLNNGKIGFGTTTPSEQITITGNIKFPETTASTGQIKIGSYPYLHFFGAQNVFLGERAGNLSMSATSNIGIGWLALLSATNGGQNVAIGSQALQNNTEGFRNVAVGASALQMNTTGNNNFALGYAALGNSTSGYTNVAIGVSALQSNTGNSNVAIGTYSLLSNTYGQNNVGIGHESGRTITTGARNVFIGYDAGYNASQKPDVTNSTAIGYNTYTTANNQVVIGNSSVTQTLLQANVGIASSSPGYGLTVVGTGSFSQPIFVGTPTNDAHAATKGYVDSAAGGGNIWISSSTYLYPTSTSWNVGVGTTTPTYKLTVAGEVYSTGSSTASAFCLSGTCQTSWSGIGTSYLTLNGNSLYPTSTSYNLGIGTTTPNNKIQVNGLINFDDTNFNTLLGSGAGGAGTNQLYNTSIGYQAGKNNNNVSSDQGQYNTYIGYTAGLGLATGDKNRGKYNVGIGANALKVNETGYGNAGIGSFVLAANTTGYYNTAIGYAPLFTNTQGYANTAIGYVSLYYNTTGYSNVAIGYNSMARNTEGNSNLAIGNAALYTNTTGLENTGIGNSALYYNTIGRYNVGNGSYALYKNTEGWGNVGIGLNALYWNTTNSYSSAIGSNAMVNSTGAYNTGIGAYAGYTESTGASNVFLGYAAGYYETGSNKLFIDNATRASEADGREKALIYGVFAAAPANQKLTINGFVGISTTTPTYNLDVVGTAQFSQPVFVGTPTQNSHAATKAYVDASGGGNWTLGSGILYSSSTFSVGIGTSTFSSSTFKLSVAGDVYLGDGGGGTDLVVFNGSGKIDAGTVDPVYTIDGKRFATYMAGMTGVKEETTGQIILGKEKTRIINFKNLEEGSDLWLFAKTTNLQRNFANMTVLLTPSFDGRVWYEKDAENLRLTIRGSGVGEVSYRLTARRFDYEAWPNTSDAPHEGFNLDKLIFSGGEVDIKSLLGN